MAMNPRRFRRPSRWWHLLAIVFFLVPSSRPLAAPSATFTPFLRLTSGQAGDQFGWSVSSAGDVNGDGYEDVVVGAPFSSVGGIRAGRAYVYFGGPVLDSLPDVTMAGSSENEWFGGSVSTAGDFNGDGYADVVVGGLARRTYIFFGGPAMDAAPDLVLADSRGATSAGDMNGDGFTDLFVAGAACLGTCADAFVYFGGPGWDAVPDAALSRGGSASRAGDLNRDGFADLTVSEPGWRAYVFYGGQEIHGSPGLQLDMPGCCETRPNTVSGGGDINGDGYPDLTVAISGDPNWYNPWTGLAYVFWGGPAMDGAPDRILSQPTDGRFFGESICSSRDVNGDGFADVVVGERPNNILGPVRGRAHIFYGGADFDSVPDVVLVAEVPGSGFGRSVAEADLDGDGIADVIVGAPGWSVYQPDLGHVYLYSLAAPLVARAFVQGPSRTVPLVDAPSQVCVRFEPVDGDYQNSDVDLLSVRLVSPGTGEVGEILAANPKIVIEGDADQNGIAELSVCFARSDLARLFSAVQGRQTLEVSLEGSLRTRRKFAAPLTITVLGTGKPAAVAASIAPNPMNPKATLTFSMPRAGDVTIHLYDIGGRRVRTVAEHMPFPAGTHRIPMSSWDDGGAPLASGVYFYRVETADGIVQGRVVVAK